MPEYSPSRHIERLFFGSVIVAGCVAAAQSAIELLTTPRPGKEGDWLVLAALTLITGSFTIRIPRLSIRISVSDAFVFAAVLIYGRPEATVIVAIDSVVATLWMRRENRSVFRSAFNLSVASLSIWVASTAYAWIPPLLANKLFPLFVLASLYFIFNSWLIAAALAFQRTTRVWKIWWTHFPWFSLNYFGGVSAAALIVSYTELDLNSMGVIVPLLVILYLTYRTSLERVEDAQRHVEQMNDLYMSTIEALAMAVDAKDQITHGHIRRVQVYAVELARRLGVDNAAHLNAIETAALLHDMGKLAIPEYILNKPGALTTSEFDRMKRHAEIGADLLSSIRFPYPVVPIVRHHHESWNGSGYPTGIGGTDIPLGARILSVVDCFDALTSDRPYRPKLDTESAFAILRDRRGTMYDPLVVDSFINAYPDIAPKAIQAGLEARTMTSADSLGAVENTISRASLAQIRSNSFESSILADLNNRLVKASTTQAILDEICRHLRQLTPATVFALYLRGLNDDTLTCDSSAGDARGLLPGLTIRIGERITGWCASTHRASLNSHAYLDLGPISELFQPHLVSTISMPILRNDRVIAVLSAYSPTTNAFSDRHRSLFEYVAQFVSDKFGGASMPQSAHRSVLAFPNLRGG